VFGGVKNLQLADSRLDAVFFINIYHDVFYSEASGEAISPVASSLLKEMHRILKPGGIVGVIDHLADPESTRSDAAELHRIAESTLVADFESAGFELVGSQNVLRNSEDDHTQAWFQDPDLKDRTDRAVLKFRKPD
jgi:predicted methyltransferase